MPARSRRARRRTKLPTRSSAGGAGNLLDLKEIRRDPDAARAALERRNAGERLDEALSLDERRRELLPQVENLRAERNSASERIGRAKKAGQDASEAIAAMQDLAPRVKELEEELRSVEEQLNAALASLPNLPLPSSPTEEEVVREWGEAGREGRDHLELLGDMVDMEAGARLSGSRFVYLRGPVVMLQFAL